MTDLLQNFSAQLLCTDVPHFLLFSFYLTAISQFMLLGFLSPSTSTLTQLLFKLFFFGCSGNTLALLHFPSVSDLTNLLTFAWKCVIPSVPSCFRLFHIYFSSNLLSVLLSSCSTVSSSFILVILLSSETFLEELSLSILSDSSPSTLQV